jgi:hypothetical protein
MNQIVILSTNGGILKGKYDKVARKSIYIQNRILNKIFDG